MITVPTVLILGAGASAPYAFPWGVALKQEIVRGLGDSREAQFRQLLEAGLSEAAVRDFSDALFYSGKDSVDAFLEHRPQFLDVGKAALAQALIPREEMRDLFSRGDWYPYLFQRLNATLSDFSRNALTVVTYNYDRSFEQYMFTALKNSYGLTDDEVARTMSAIPVIHVHGRLGYLPWEAEGGRAYQPSCGPAEIQLAARSIKIIHESIESDAEYRQVFKYLGQAKRVIFLGFGYHETNVQRLKPEESMVNSAVLGTCFNMTGLESSRVVARFHRGITLGTPASDTLAFLRTGVDL